MSYDCYINHKDGSEYMVSSAPKGGTYRLSDGGPEPAWFNITYNYGKFIYPVLEGGIPGLDGRPVEETIEPLRKAIEKLGDDVDSDYWKATEGNAKIALQDLLQLALQCPGGVWEVC